LRACRSQKAQPPQAHGAWRTVGQVLGYKQHLLRRRHVREIRQESLEPGTQNLIWLDGEALCLTREFLEALEGVIPVWLTPRSEEPTNDDKPPITHWLTFIRRSLPIANRTRIEVPLPGNGTGILVRRRAHQPWWWLYLLLGIKALPSPEMRQAGILFRLQRYGIATPRLLGVGQHHPRPSQTESLLLIEKHTDTMPLATWLNDPSLRAEEPALHWWILREMADLLRHMHEACCYLIDWGKSDETQPWCVQSVPGQKPIVRLGNVEGIRTRRRPSQQFIRHDLMATMKQLADGGCTRADQLRFWCAYHERQDLQPADKRFLQPIVRGWRKDNR
jgi:hypothetical protein